MFFELFLNRNPLVKETEKFCYLFYESFVIFFCREGFQTCNVYSDGYKKKE